jgi:hypothetical protein
MEMIKKKNQEIRKKHVKYNNEIKANMNETCKLF